MSSAPNPEELNPVGFAAFGERTGEQSPVAILNLLAFRPDGGRERYMEHGVAVAPLLEKVGGRIGFGGRLNWAQRLDEADR
jgi:hypothetical protein